jgi:DNA polymerase
VYFIRDSETKSTCNLKTDGIYKYAQHPSTDILCVGYCLDDGDVKIWKPGQPVPKEAIAAFKNKQAMAVAHNAPFDILIERYILGPKYGWPVFPVERNLCTMACANAMALPPSLENVARVCSLPYQKDKVGGRVMLQVTKPRKARKGEDASLVHWYNDEERISILEEYCKVDIATTRELLYSIPLLSDEEHKVWVLDQKINARGLYIDATLTSAAEKIIKEAGEYIVEKIAEYTNGEVTSINQVAKLVKWLSQYIDITDLNKTTIEEFLEDDNIVVEARRVLELRYLGAQAATKKVKALTDRREKDGRVRGAFIYHAAGTGRWSSRGAQLHNLKRSQTEDIKGAIAVIRKGSFAEASKKYAKPLAVIGDLVRAMVSAKPGHVLIGADFSGIEARMTAWVSEEESKLNVFRDYDAKRGPDPYVIAGAKINNVDANELYKRYKAKIPSAIEMRQQGKVAELAFGYGGSVGAYRRFSGDTNLTDEAIAHIRDAWRGAHPNIERYWRALKRAHYDALGRPGVIQDCGVISLLYDQHQRCMFLTLPSGRQIAYPGFRSTMGIVTDKGRIVEVAKGKALGLGHVSEDSEEGGSKPRSMLLFKDNRGGRWEDTNWWFGLAIENIVQAAARDLLAEAMLRIDNAGLTIVGHIHDECLIEVPAKDAEKVKPLFQKLMEQRPTWGPDMPIVANPWVSERYSKDDHEN